MECVAFLLTFLFGIFLVLVGILMYFNPTVVRNLIRKAGSSYGTNFLELGPRLLIGLAIIKVDTDFEVLYNSMGYFLVVSAFVIGLLPLKLHNGFSRKAADFLKPNYLKCLAPISICLGFLVIYGII
ncbi:hypothetical protein [Imtechella halotolerans]|uniref:Uncharacterized protein n=1 Tax=Imtechella halotolerans K1 TaxID=946077 RepID=I0WE43_9FLAO|nr:hypothetical protein [Imtechella halotolerans]EID74659.1 hypothetical protein W5A_07762 [Imtechella halotolerans K1]WMQ64220.1 hypothetical protein PT603_04400 [Imtechella halotolerans]